MGEVLVLVHDPVRTLHLGTGVKIASEIIRRNPTVTQAAAVEIQAVELVLEVLSTEGGVRGVAGVDVDKTANSIGKFATVVLARRRGISPHDRLSNALLVLKSGNVGVSAIHLRPARAGPVPGKIRCQPTALAVYALWWHILHN